MRALGFFLVVLTLGVAGCGGGSSSEGKIVAAFYPLAWATQEVAAPSSGVVDLTPPGAEPHDVELYAEVRTYQGMIMERLEEYPGTEEILADSLSECIARYEKFVGTPYRDSEYDVVALAPTGELWLDRQQRVSMCGVTSTDGSKLEGSVRGASG